MSGPAWNNILEQVRGLVRPPDGGLTDAQLLTRWLAHRDEAAFELLLWRHGPTVRGVCRRLLQRPQDIEDAFQATFLVFLRKAGTIGKRDAVASWLYKVAYRIALDARRLAARQELLDGKDVLVPAPQTADALAWRDVRPVLDDEVNRLPHRYRRVFVLCYLQGKSNEEAARELGLPTGTVQSQLSRARAKLRVRLTRRGVTLTAGALAAGLAEEAFGALPASLVSSTLKAALLGAAEKAVTAGVVTAEAAALAKGALHTMWMTKVQLTAALLLTVALLGGGAFTYRTLAAGPAEAPGKDKVVSVPADKGEPEDLRAEVRRLRDEVEKHKTDKVALAQRVRELEEELASTRTTTGSTFKGQPFSVDLGMPSPPAASEPATSRGTLQEANDAVEILREKINVKKAELQSAMVDLRAAQRDVNQVSALAKSNAVSAQEVAAAQDKVARGESAVRVKEAELHEEEIYLKQAMRRVEFLQPAKTAERPAPHTTELQQLQDIRKQVEQLQRKLDGLEKAMKAPTQSERRP